MRLAFLGWYDRNNCGDEAFKEVHRLLFPDHDLRWVCDRPIDPAQVDHVVLGGGDVLLEYYLDCIPPEMKFWVYGVGLGGARAYQIIEAQRARIRGLWLRNRGDVEELQNRGIAAHYTPDIVFNLRQIALGQPPAGGKQIKRLVVILSNNLYQAAMRGGAAKTIFYLDYFKYELASALNALAHFYEVVLLPFSMDPNDFDPGFCADVYAIMRKFYRPDSGEPAVRMITTTPDPLAVIALLRDADLVLSMKFHGLIFAAMLGVPFVNIGISRKTALFCEDNGLPHLSIDEYSFTKERLLARVKAAEAPQTRAELAVLGESLFGQAQQAATIFREALLSG